MKFMGCLNEDAKKKKKDTFCMHIGGRAVLITTGSNLLDTKCKFYGFKDDLRDTIKNEYHFHKAGFCKYKYRL